MDASALAAVLAWGALKGALLLAAAGLATLALRESSAAARHAVWAVALCAALVLPALDALGPAWRLAVLPAAHATQGAAAAVESAEGLAGWALVGVWLVGLLAVSTRWIASAVAARRLVSRSRAVLDGAWQREATRIGRDIGLRRPVELRESDDIRSPVTWGVFQAVLLLPAGVDDWTAERRLAILTHELSHVRRRDCLTGLMAEAACAVHWFNPLAWLAYRRLHVERERACDDGVLLGGLRASHYASHLLSVARDAGACEPAAPRLAPALARRSEMEERIRAMLDGRPRSGPMSRASVVALAVTALASAGLVGVVEPVRRATPADAAVAELSVYPELVDATAILPPVPAVPPVPDELTAVAPPAPRAPRRFAPPAPPDPPSPPEMPAPTVAFAISSDRPHVARILSWRAPSGPSPSDEPRLTVRAVRVAAAHGPQHFAFVLPDLPASVWRERSDEVWAYVERAVAREVQAHIEAGARPGIGVRPERFVVAVRRKPGGASVDSAALGGYRSPRDELSARTKAGT